MTRILLDFLLVPSPFPTFRPCVDTLWWCRSGMHDWRDRYPSVVSIAEPISVIPASLHQNTDFLLMPEPNWPTNVPIPDWHGVPCNIARTVMLWRIDPLTVRRFRVLVLLPQSDPPDLWWPHVHRIHLGMQFLIEYDAILDINVQNGQPSGSIDVP